jgi:5-methylcytosine-specific restriction protein A
MFELGRVYRRDDLHHAWGGNVRVQTQGGILTPREAPLVLAITGEEGSQYGYDDFQDADGVFHYYGAGQEGDMEWLRGNSALRDHSEKGEEVHLFEQVENGLRYKGQYVCAGYYEQDGVPDLRRQPRRAIVFELVPLDDGDLDDQGDSGEGARLDSRWTMPLAHLRDRASRSAENQPNAREAKRRTYARSEDLRVYVRRRAEGRCEGCGSAAPFVTAKGHPYLEPHHTRRLSDGGPDDYHHVIALCPTCHRRVHHGADGDTYNAEMVTKLQAIEPA